MPRIVLLFALCSITAIGQVPELPVSPKATHPLFDPDDRPPKHPLREKLDNIIFPKVEFDAVPFETVVNYLKTRSRELDPDGEGVNFFLQLDPEVEEALITVDFHNIPLGALLHYQDNCTITWANARSKLPARLLPLVTWRRDFIRSPMPSSRM